MAKNKFKVRAGRLGAIALNSNPHKKRLAALKAAQTRLKKNPSCFSDMGKLKGKIITVNL